MKKTLLTALAALLLLYLLPLVPLEGPGEPGEPLKAQAVAARTYALYCAAGPKHGQADLCADPGCCQAWLSPEQLRENWGEDFEQNLARIRAAVEEAWA